MLSHFITIVCENNQTLRIVGIATISNVQTYLKIEPLAILAHLKTFICSHGVHPEAKVKNIYGFAKHEKENDNKPRMLNCKVPVEEELLQN